MYHLSINKKYSSTVYTENGKVVRKRNGTQTNIKRNVFLLQRPLKIRLVLISLKWL